MKGVVVVWNRPVHRLQAVVVGEGIGRQDGRLREHTYRTSSYIDVVALSLLRGNQLLRHDGQLVTGCGAVSARSRHGGECGRGADGVAPGVLRCWDWDHDQRPDRGVVDDVVDARAEPPGLEDHGEDEWMRTPSSLAAMTPPLAISSSPSIGNGGPVALAEIRSDGPECAVARADAQGGGDLAGDSWSTRRHSCFRPPGGGSRVTIASSTIHVGGAKQTVKARVRAMAARGQD